jgi:hypothetical protein
MAIHIHKTNNNSSSVLCIVQVSLYVSTEILYGSDQLTNCINFYGYNGEVCIKYTFTLNAQHKTSDMTKVPIICSKIYIIMRTLHSYVQMILLQFKFKLNLPIYNVIMSLVYIYLYGYYVSLSALSKIP